jgi:tetratricopeptide (TPR) repeat protein
VRKVADKLRITGQLVDASSGVQLWADRLDGEMHDVFEVQERFAAGVTAAVEPTIQVAEIERLRLKPFTDLDAYDLLLRAQQCIYEFTEDSLRRGLNLLEKALELDEAYAPALAAAAYCYAQLYNCGWMSDVDGETAKGLQLAERSVEKGKEDSNVLWMAAFAVWMLGGSGPRAKALVARSLERNPNSAIALGLAGWIESTMGQIDKAFELIAQSRRLNPRDPHEWFVSAAMAAACLEAEKFDECVIWAESAIGQNPRFNTARRICAAGLAKLGRAEEAVTLLRKVREMEPNLTLFKLRERLRYMDRSVWNHYYEALRLAGFSE